MDWKWNPPAFGIGWLVSLVALIAVLLLAFMGLVSKEAVLVVAAICAIRL